MNRSVYIGCPHTKTKLNYSFHVSIEKKYLLLGGSIPSGDHKIKKTSALHVPLSHASYTSKSCIFNIYMEIHIIVLEMTLIKVFVYFQYADHVKSKIIKNKQLLQYL